MTTGLGKGLAACIIMSIRRGSGLGLGLGSWGLTLGMGMGYDSQRPRRRWGRDRDKVGDGNGGLKRELDMLQQGMGLRGLELGRGGKNGSRQLGIIRAQAVSGVSGVRPGLC